MLMLITACYAFTAIDLFMKQDFPLAFMFLFYGASCICLIFKV